MEQTPHYFLISYQSEGTEPEAISTDFWSICITGLRPETEYTVTVCTQLQHGGKSQPTSKRIKTATAPGLLSTWKKQLPTGAPLRIVLIGRDGVGKSASGNTILGRDEFDSYLSSSLVTQTCTRGSIDSPRHIEVVDTPGILDTDKSAEDVKKEIVRSIKCSCPGPHVFLLVIDSGRFTKQEQNAVKALQEIFGPNAVDYMIVLVTRGDQLRGKTLDSYVQNAHPKMREVIDSCGGRCHMFNNMSKDRRQVTELIRKIDMMMERNRGRYYTEEMYEAHRITTDRELTT